MSNDSKAKIVTHKKTHRMVFAMGGSTGKSIIRCDIADTVKQKTIGITKPSYKNL